MYISTFRSGKDNEVFINNPRTTFGDYRKKEIKLIEYFCLQIITVLVICFWERSLLSKIMEQEFLII